MFFDGHTDIFTDVTIRMLAGENDILNKHHLDRLKAGQIEGGIFVLWCDPPYDNDPRTRTLDILHSIQRELRNTSNFITVTSYDDIIKAKAEDKIYMLLGIEGLSGIGYDIDLIDYFYSFGIRHAMLTWNEQNLLATGVGGDPARGLTDAGKKAVAKIQEKRMLMDVSHLNETSFWDVMNIVTNPPIASHSNARALCDVPRNLSDDQLKLIRDYEGLVGLNAYHRFVSADPLKQDAEHFIAHLAYIADLIGPEFIGFGFDFYEFLNGSGADSDPERISPTVTGLEDCTHTHRLLSLLREAGFSQSEIEGFMYRNWHRVIKDVIG